MLVEMIKEFATARQCIKQHLPTKALTDAIAIHDWGVAIRSPDAAKRFLTQGLCLLPWIMKSGVISHNPFDGMALKVKRSKEPCQQSGKRN